MRVGTVLDQLLQDLDPGGAQQLAQLAEVVALGQDADDHRLLVLGAPLLLQVVDVRRIERTGRVLAVCAAFRH